MKVKIAAVVSAGIASGRMDAPVDAPRTRPVDDRGLVEFARDAAEELVEQEDEEGVRGQELRDDQRQDRVDPVEVEEEHVLRDQGHVVGQHERAQHQREPEALERELQPREGIGRKRARHHVADDAQGRDHGRIPEERPEADRQPGPAARIGARREGLRDDRGVAEDLLVGLKLLASIHRSG
jgi:hypothetical protein